MVSCWHYYSDPVLKLCTFSKDQGHRTQLFLLYESLGPFWTIVTSRIVDYYLILEQKHIIDILSKTSLTTLEFSIWNNKYSIFSHNYENACLSIILSSLDKPSNPYLIYALWIEWIFFMLMYTASRSFLWPNQRLQ